jgi:hypothetical protein
MNAPRTALTRSLILLLACTALTLSACESADESLDNPSPTASPDAALSTDGGASEDGTEPTVVDGSATEDTGPVDPADGGAAEPDVVVTGCIDDSECEDLDPCTANVCDVATGECDFPASPSAPECQEAPAVCGDGVCSGDETSESCPGDCKDPGPGPGGAGSCAGKCGVYDIDANCQCDSACEIQIEPDCCADYLELCGCDPANPPSCIEDADCGDCNAGGDLCAGTFTCVSGQCAMGDPIVCDTSGDTECLQTTCDSFSGQCLQNVDSSVCEDGDYCTSDICDEMSGACQFEAIEACGQNYACEDSQAPTSDDADITACVCDGVGAENDYTGDSYCCESAWDSLCVQQAQDNCGVNCNCEELALEASPALACESDADCGWCNPENPCDGAWTCQESVCVQQGKVECDSAADTECMQSVCNPQTLHCDMVEVLSACDDEDSCTQDICTEEGACVHEAGCGTNNPCATSSFPESKDETMNACVCEGAGASEGFEGDSFCCENSWDGICVNEAATYCGAVCDCADPAFDPTCGDASDCVFCSDDVCAASWDCVDGQCADTGPLVCDVANADSCIQNSCDSFAGGCEVMASIEACDDGDDCTWDFCDAESGACSNEVIEGCAGSPPFECLGGGEASAMGCDAVDTFEGCCDPWGRVLWCGQDQDGQDVTYCMDCAGAPYCGWNSSWYWCDTEAPGMSDPSGAFPLQCSGLTYAP